MAYENSVPLGQAGTGAAFILPESKSLDMYLSGFALREHNAALAQQAALKQQAATNKSYDDNALKIVPGQLFGSEVNGLLQQNLVQGAKYRQQGFDIYHPDPTNKQQVAASEQYMSDRATLEQLMNYRKGLDENYSKGLAMINDPNIADKLDPDSVKAWKDFYESNPDQNKLQQSFFGKIQPPTLETTFSPSDFSKNYVKPETITHSTNNGFQKTETKLPDVKGIQTQVEQGLLTDPKSVKMLIKSGVDVGYIQGKKDKTGVMRDVDQFYRTDEGKKELESQGIEYNSDDYWKKIVPAAANKRIEASMTKYNKIRDGLVDANAAKVATEHNSQKEYAGLNYALALRSSNRADEMLELAKQRLANSKKDKEIFSEPDFNTLKITTQNNKLLPDGTENPAAKTNPKYNYSTWTTSWQPVKGEGIAVDVPNYKEIDMSGHLVESKRGNISRMRLLQVGQLPRLASGSYANDATLSHLADQMKIYSGKHPDAATMPINSGGSLKIPKDKSQINAMFLYEQLPKEDVAVMYDDQNIKDGKLATGARPILIPAKGIMSKIKANKIKVPDEKDPLNISTGFDENDPLGLGQ